MAAQNRRIDTITLEYHHDEEDTADILDSACGKAVELARDIWGLDPPEDCHIYVMTSWLGFIFQSAPWSWRILLGMTMPFWAARARRTWPYSAGWTQKYGRRTAIGVKPARLLSHSKSEAGVRMFIEEKDMDMNIRHVTCHELIHACSAHLRLPMWLNEGIAETTVDTFLGKQTIRQDTLELMKNYRPKTTPPNYRELSRMGLEAIAYHGVRGYWLVRYLEEKHPGLLRRILTRKQDAYTIERTIAAEAGIKPENFWNDIDDVVVGHFEGETRAGKSE